MDHNMKHTPNYDFDLFPRYEPGAILGKFVTVNNTASMPCDCKKKMEESSTTTELSDKEKLHMSMLDESKCTAKVKMHMLEGEQTKNQKVFMVVQDCKNWSCMLIFLGLKGSWGQPLGPNFPSL